MKTHCFFIFPLLVACLGLSLRSFAQAPPEFTRVQPLTNREIGLTLTGQAAAFYQIDTTTNLAAWDGLVTAGSGAASSIQHTDSAAPFLTARYYRAQQIMSSNVFTGDHFSTTNGDLLIHPDHHATLILNWQSNTIYIDPTNSAGYAGLPKANLILVTHSHPDHFNTAVINAVIKTNGLIVTSQEVYNQLTASQKPIARVLGYGATTNLLGVDIQAVAAYNSYHPFGTGNGYVLTLGGRRIFISGDTGNTAEMRALTNIDLAFVCMNQPYTMTVSEATNAVTAFRPKIIYPYHYRDQSGASANAAVFKQRLRPDLGIEVRLRNWY
ncbi:MAG TPA: MBL fold metallo-hydrolase [Candidatus Limnocylindrales bacterium]|nr:MBL fold metallo-hydrolase [Candidatus Limnocylindrales bacterium]